MKHLKVIFLIVFIISFVQLSMSAHMNGGEITWRCIPSTGKLEFRVEMYRNCQILNGGLAANWSFDSTSYIIVTSTQLPRDSMGYTVQSIMLKPDSSKWNLMNQGLIVPQCNTSGPKKTCGTGSDGGLVQKFYYKSDPITLIGVPPSSGWHFYVPFVCCKGTLTNAPPGAAGYSSGLILRATMYPDAQNSNVQNCKNSSPKFREHTIDLICRSMKYEFNYSAFDQEGDSLSYHLAPPINTPPPTGVPMAYNAPWSFNSPTPLPSQDSNNIPLTIDPETGHMRIAVFSNYGSGLMDNYATVINVKEWRDGKLIGSIYREMPLRLFDCRTILNGAVNKSPTVVIAGNNSSSSMNQSIIDLVAGQAIDLPINASDFDISSTGTPQKLNLSPRGQMFANDFTDSTNCETIFDPKTNTSRALRPCAILKNSNVTFNSTVTPSQYEITGLSGISTQFIWQSSCNHLFDTDSLNPNQSSTRHNFVLDIQDDHCPLPALSQATISVNLKAPLPIAQPIMKGISVGLDGKVTYQWAPPTDTANTFDNYQVQQTNIPDGNQPAFGSLLLNSDLRKYSPSQKIFGNYPIYLNANDIRTKVPGIDWYFRMKTESGCSGNEESVWSDPCRIMELETNPSGPVTDPNSRVTLSWNSPKAINASTDQSYLYESNTHYYIWQNNKVATATEAKTESNWTIVGDTSDLFYEIESNSCSDFVGFRIEARDTVILYKQGVQKSKNQYDTLYFSSFSVVDTILMSSPQAQIENINFESLMSSLTAINYEWRSCSTNQLLDSLHSFIPQDSGLYQLINIFPGGCSDTTECFDVEAHTIQTSTPDNQTITVISNAKFFQWIDCRADTIIPGETLRSFQPQDTGYYAVEVRTFGYKDTSDCIPMLAIGLNEIKSHEPQIDIFPNPTKGLVTIQTEAKINSIELRSMDGRLISPKWNSQENTLQLPKEKGMYFLQLKTTQGEVISRKVVKI